MKIFLPLLFLSFTACVTNKAIGDRAFEAGQYKDALAIYEKDIREGSEDPDLYRNAANAAVNEGAFGVAERYFSKSLRYGGGIPVARELAEFYVQTSNYASAVRVYQYLLTKSPNSQPVYNNLGTALLYAGSPFDAENYLILAQQLNPNDPIPYVNLGLLYDKHFRQPSVAIGFYKCFLKIAPNDPNSPTVRQRTSELAEKVRRLSPPEIACDEPYFQEQNATALKAIKPAMREIDLQFATEDSKEPGGVEIVNEGRGEVDSKLSDIGQQPSVEQPKTKDVEGWFKIRAYPKVIDLLEKSAPDELSPREKYLLGFALRSQQQKKRAVTVL